MTTRDYPLAAQLPL